jgi:hypothetical protein
MESRFSNVKSRFSNVESRFSNVESRFINSLFLSLGSKSVLQAFRLPKSFG